MEFINKIPTKGMQKLTKGEVSEEKEKFRIGRNCVEQTFNFRMITERIVVRQGQCLLHF